MKKLISAVSIATFTFALAGCSTATPVAQTVRVTETQVRTTSIPTTVVKSTTRTSKVTATVTSTEGRSTNLPADVEAVCDGWTASMQTGIGPLMAKYATGEQITIGELHEALAAYEAPTLLDLTTLELLQYSDRYAAVQASVYLLLTTKDKGITDLSQDDADRVSAAVMTGAGICSSTFKEVPPANS